MFVSIKRYLDNRPEQVAGALLQMVRLLLQGIELHAVKGDLTDYDKFRGDLQKIQHTLGDAPAASEVLVLAGSAVKALEEYNSRVSRYVHVQTTELQTMIGMLAKTMSAIADHGDGSVARLQDIEKQLHKASMIEDYQTAKIRLAECLGTLRSEIGRQRETSARHVAELTTAIRETHERITPRSAEAGAGAQQNDSITGLPLRPEAETAIAAALNQGRRVFAVIFIIERIDLINTRFGQGVGDQILLFFCQHLMQHFTGADKLFRWSGPAVLAVLEREGSIGQLRDEITKIGSKRLSKTVQVGARSVLLPIAANWTVFSALDVRPLPMLLHQIDSFISGAIAERVTA